jgi:exo-poly-alpha-galacturonosidase
MKISTTLLLFLALSLKMTSFAANTNIPKELKSPVGTATETTIVLIWDKPDKYADITEYAIYQNGKFIASSPKTNYTVHHLTPNTTYSYTIKSKNAKDELSVSGNEIKVTTKKSGKVFNIMDYGARGDSITLNTKAIQKAINACTPCGTVLIPEGIFLSGALYFKSNMTLYIKKGGVLKGSIKIADYDSIITTRFEGWEVKSYSSLITAGTYDPIGKTNIHDLTIRGEGKIYGGGTPLGKAMIAAKGLRGRGRLICIMNCENLDIQGLAIENPPCWTIHYTYCRNVNCHDLNIYSNTANGDGIDPDSSVDSEIFNCTFSTGDDCIAIKSGKNPEGNIVNKPTENIRITNCSFPRGHSLAIGSEMSGGVKNVYIRDCELGKLLYGLQIKGSKERGGYVENVVAKDCDLQQIKIVTSFNYNNDGAAATELPIFQNMEFSNLDMRKAGTRMPVIYMEGFDDPSHFTKNITLRNILLPEGSNVYLKNCDHITFENVLQSPDKQKPVYNVISSTNISY